MFLQAEESIPKANFLSSATLQIQRIPPPVLNATKTARTLLESPGGKGFVCRPAGLLAALKLS